MNYGKWEDDSEIHHKKLRTLIKSTRIFSAFIQCCAACWWRWSLRNWLVLGWAHLPSPCLRQDNNIKLNDLPQALVGTPCDSEGSRCERWCGWRRWRRLRAKKWQVVQKKKESCDLAKFCNLLCNLPLLPSPKSRQVNYIILYLAGVLYATLSWSMDHARRLLVSTTIIASNSAIMQPLLKLEFLWVSIK